MTQGAEVTTGSIDARELLARDIQQLGQRLVAEVGQLDLNKIIENLTPEQIGLLRYASDVLIRVANHAETAQVIAAAADTVALRGLPTQHEAEEPSLDIPTAEEVMEESVLTEQDEEAIAAPLSKEAGAENPEAPKQPPVNLVKLVVYARQKGWFKMEDLRRDIPEIAALSANDYLAFKQSFGDLRRMILTELRESGENAKWLEDGRNRGKKYYLAEIVGKDAPAQESDPVAEPASKHTKAPKPAKAATEVAQTSELAEAAEDIAFADEMEILSEPYWNEEDRVSLLDLLEGKIDQGDEAARFHIKQLLACFAPHRGDGEILDRVEWDTLNYLTGYRFSQQGLKVLSWSMLRVRMHQPYEQVGKTQEQVFASAFGKLLRRAANEYAAGWYPKIKEELTEKSESESLVAPSAKEVVTEEASEDGRPRQLLEKIVRLNRITPAHVAPLEAHLVGKEGPKAEQTRLAQQGLTILARMLSETEFRNRRSYAASGGNQKGDLTTNEKRVMRWLVGDSATGIAPEPFARLVKSDKIRQLGITPETLPTVIRKALAKIAKDA